MRSRLRTAWWALRGRPIIANCSLVSCHLSDEMTRLRFVGNRTGLSR